jgi:hypothetical protein
MPAGRSTLVWLPLKAPKTPLMLPIGRGVFNVAYRVLDARPESSFKCPVRSKKRKTAMIDLGNLKKQLQLTASIDELRKMYDKIDAFLAPLTVEQRQLCLLIMERLALGDKGHLGTLKFGHNTWNGNKCCVCHVPLEQEGQAVWLISRWENSSVMLCLCKVHAEQTFEVDVDILTGALKSKIGHP